jgi:hypothetical protein
VIAIFNLVAKEAESFPQITSLQTSCLIEDMIFGLDITLIVQFYGVNTYIRIFSLSSVSDSHPLSAWNNIITLSAEVSVFPFFHSCNHVYIIYKVFFMWVDILLRLRMLCLK